MPRTGLERLVRAWTPYHYFLCRDCEYRGAHLGMVPSSSGGAGDRVTSRPVEQRDQAAGRRRRQQLVTSFLLAAALGTASGAYLHSCRRSSEVGPPPPDVEQHKIE
jgi:hypothetical protein